jgi:mannose PTS system EIIA component
MVGILIFTHNFFGESFTRCAGQMLGKFPSRIEFLGVCAGDDPDAVLPRAQELVSQLDEGDGVLILTDIVGATPSNIATQLAVPGRVEVVAGLNLPMLMRAITYREEPLAVVVDKAVSGGREGALHVCPEKNRAARRS